MARTRRPVTKLQITDAEHSELKARLRVRKAPEDEKLRMRIVLGCAAGKSGKVIAERLQTTIQTVSKWRRRYEAYRLAGLTDAPRAGRPRSVDDEQVQQIVDKVRQSTPTDATHWSVRQMSRQIRNLSSGTRAPTPSWHPSLAPRPNLLNIIYETLH